MNLRFESGGALPHSRTLSQASCALRGSGRFWTAPVPCRFRMPLVIAFSCAFLPAVDGRTQSVESVIAKSRDSVVVISQFGRDGKEDGVGAGFAIASNLVATALHVIGESRRITVRLANGKELDASEIHAWDRKLDLAIVRVEAANLPQLPLGDSQDLKQGAAVIAIGNPLGLDTASCKASYRPGARLMLWT